jgi:GTP-binding protein
VADEGINTLIDFRHQRRFKAERGENGMGRQMAGRGGDDVVIRVPVGTAVVNVDTDEQIGDLTEHGQRLLVAQGGIGGKGNIHYKSSVNRLAAKSTPGTPGDERELRLELKLLGGRGPAGLPERRQEHVHPRRSPPRARRWPTTRSPRCTRTWAWSASSAERSFVIADIPGLIEGAAEGAGPRHPLPQARDADAAPAARRRHGPADDSVDPAEEVRTIAKELKKFDAELAKRPRWLVLNKADLLPEDEREARAKAIVRKLRWTKPWFMVSAATGEGTLAVSRKSCSSSTRTARAARKRRKQKAGCYAGPAEPSWNRGSGAQRLDPRREAALVAVRLVLVDQATAAVAVEQRLGGLVGGLGACLVLGIERLGHFLERRAHHGALAGVARVAHHGLLGAFLRGLDVGQRNTPGRIRLEKTAHSEAWRRSSQFRGPPE